MKPQLIDLLASMERMGRENDERESDRARKMLNLEPQTARLMNILARSSGAKRALEIGTSNGYSTIWLASAIAEAGGTVISIERNPEKQKLARENLACSGLLDHVELRLGDATAIVRELTGRFDFVFFDGDRISAPDQLKLIPPKLSPAVFVLADNALSHPAEIAGYLATVTSLDGFEHMIVPVGKGLSLAYRGAGSAVKASGGVE
jgi:predicted O-methyltransferase YrrM